jgi:hypothetical protein
MSSLRRIAASFVSAVLLASALGAQTADPGELYLHAYTLKHRRASEAFSLVSPLLSPRGTVEVQPATNTLVIRDTMGALSRIIPRLRNFDHPARPLSLELYIVRASRSIVSPPVLRSDLPEPLTRRLRALLAYDVYEVQAQALLSSVEGQAVTYALASDYEVSFRLGTILQDRRVRLSDFRILRRSDGRNSRPMIHTNLNLRLDQTTSLGLARSESSPEALMVVLTLRNGDPARRQQRAEQ